MIRKVALLAAAGSLVLAGCGAGHNAESTKPTRLTEGVNVSQNGIDVRNLFILGPTPGSRLPLGSSLTVYGSLINNGASAADALTGVSVEGGLVELATVKGGALELPRHKAVNLGQPVEQTGPQPTAAPTTSATPEDGQPTAPAQAGQNAFPVLLKGTKKEFHGGEYLRLTLQFRNAQAIKLSVQIIPAHGEFSTLAPAPATTPSQDATTVPEATPGAENGLEATPASRPTKKAKATEKPEQESAH